MKRRWPIVAAFVLGIILGAGAVFFTRPSPRLAMPHGTEFVGSKTSLIFHRPDCRYGSKIALSNQAWFRTVDEARKAEMRACKICMPKRRSGDNNRRTSMNLPPNVVPGLLVLAGTVIGTVLGYALKTLEGRAARRQLFDHQLRLEKEYQIYAELWDRLLVLVRDTGVIVQTVGDASDAGTLEAFINEFDAYQTSVRRNEPFIHESIYGPAKRILTLGRQIHDTLRRIERAGNRRGTVDEVKEEEDNQARSDEIGELAKQVNTAIRQRIGPRD